MNRMVCAHAVVLFLALASFASAVEVRVGDAFVCGNGRPSMDYRYGTVQMTLPSGMDNSSWRVY